jgi:hypothetical protein
MKKDTFYFPHDYNARNDVKNLFLRQQLGMEGYGIFWFLIESLADSGGELPMKIIPVLSMQMQVPDVKVLAVIKNFELFQVDDENFFSSRLNVHLQMRKTLSEKGKLGVKIREANRMALCPPSSNPSSKERKKRKGKESLQGLPPMLFDVRNYFEENGYYESAADRFFSFYENLAWNDSNGNKVKNWKNKANSVWFKEENKIPIDKSRKTSQPISENKW